MTTFEAVFAAALLFWPSSSPVTPDNEPWVNVLRPSILALAIDHEILDPREKGFVMGQDAIGDLDMLRGRHREMLNMPGIGEADRFPDRKTINDLLAFNRSYRNQLTARLAIDLIFADDIRAEINHTDWLYQALDAMRDARSEWFYVTVRRNSMRTLRDMIGESNFYLGMQISPVP